MTGQMITLIPLFPLVGFLINGLWYVSKFSLGKHGSHASHGSPDNHNVTHPDNHNVNHNHNHNHNDGHNDGHNNDHNHNSGHHGGNLALVPGVIASIAIFASFVVSCLLFFHLQGLDPEHRVLDQLVFPWINVGALHLDMAFRLDSLSTLFTLVITGVGTLIHIYSIGYMGHDETPGRFFAYLNLFCFAMLMLVLGSSLPVLFLGWEGVGLCSYLLIGYWYKDIEKASAGKKAFVVNRIGDFGFLLGMFLLFQKFGTLDMSQLKDLVMHNPDTAVLTTIGILLFVGCMGKSAQIPLYVWLPDAMAGPTPVSALIHAATMVTSGIYLVSRMNFLYNLAPTALQLIAVTGAFTAFFAATIAIVQRDIKKVLAYSTVSQLGYMFLGCGVGAYSAGVMHVITHAFFKALLFLGAGSVIHGMHEEQDILKMGGLSSKMPKTYLTFAAGWLAICGIPPFSGFFSKDEILWQAFSSPHGSSLLWALGVLTAVMTAFYMTRLFCLTFMGKPRFSNDLKVHESPNSMVVPLQILAVLSVVGGFLSIPHLSWIEHWLEPVMSAHGEATTVTPALEWVLMAVSVAGAALGIFSARKVYTDLAWVNEFKQHWLRLHLVMFNKWYVDEAYEAIFVRPINTLSVWFWKSVDVVLIDGTVLGFGKVSQWLGRTFRVAQTGLIQTYALVFVIGLFATVGYLLYGMV